MSRPGVGAKTALLGVPSKRNQYVVDALLVARVASAKVRAIAVDITDRHHHVGATNGSPSRDPLPALPVAAPAGAIARGPRQECHFGLDGGGRVNPDTAAANEMISACSCMNLLTHASRMTSRRSTG
jgi:hypothetical protein